MMAELMQVVQYLVIVPAVKVLISDTCLMRLLLKLNEFGLKILKGCAAFAFTITNEQ